MWAKRAREKRERKDERGKEEETEEGKKREERGVMFTFLSLFSSVALSLSVCFSLDFIYF